MEEENQGPGLAATAERIKFQITIDEPDEEESKD